MKYYNLGLGAVLFLMAASGLAQGPLQGQSATSACAPDQYGTLPDGCTTQQDSKSLPSRGMQGVPQDASQVAPQLTAPSSAASTQRGITTPVNPSDRKYAEEPIRPRTEFEQVVADTVGRPVPLFGQSLFSTTPSTFAPLEHVQVPADYVIGPDDELQVRIWGQINADLRLVVDRAGQVYIPKVGLVSVAGVHASDLSEVLKREVEKNFRNFSLTANIGKIRSIQVFVVGDARFPGLYTISSLSTLVNAIFASGGPTPGGSLRDVQVQRGGKTLTHFDVYALLIKGDKSSDVRLQSGDVIFFPPVGALAAIAGAVNTPAIFEVKPGSTVKDLLENSGGLSAVADTSRVTLERLNGQSGRSILEFPLDANSEALPVKNGDIVHVMSTVPSFSNTVTLRGNVVNPGKYAWKEGMKVLDLIPDAQALLTRPYWLDRAVLVNDRGTEYPIPSDWRNTRTTEQPRDWMDTRTTEQSRDWVDPRATEQPRDWMDARATDQRRDMGYSVAGNSTAPKSVPRQLQSGLNGQPGQPILRPSTNPAELTRDVHRTSPEINWSYAVIQRVNPVDLSTTLVPFDLGKAVLEKDPANNIALQPNDIVTVFSQADITVPQMKSDRYVTIEGEVQKPGVYKVKEGEGLRELINRAGGLTPQAYIFGTQLTRESARIEQQKSLDEFARTMEMEMRQSMVSAMAHTSSSDAESMAAEQKAQEAMIVQIRGTKASGRVVLSMRADARLVDDYPVVGLEDNDRIVIPPMVSTVSVVGMVYSPGSFLYGAKTRVGDYLSLAGGGRRNSDMHRAFVLRADGSVLPSTAVSGLFSGGKFTSLRLYPGDQIVVPNKIQTGNFVRGLRDWTQISSQLALTGAALAVIK